MIKNLSKIIVLDRDGVINEDSDDYIKSPDEWIPINGSIDAIAKLTHNDYGIVVATNQSGLARGYLNEYDLAKIHSKCCGMVEEAGGVISAIFYCPHLPSADCSCRKPKTGLLKQTESELGVSLTDSFLIGDSMKDLEAALAFGMKPVLVRTGNGYKTELNLDDKLRSAIDVFDDLGSVTNWILASNTNR